MVYQENGKYADEFMSLVKLLEYPIAMAARLRGNEYGGCDWPFHSDDCKGLTGTNEEMRMEMKLSHS